MLHCFLPRIPTPTSAPFAFLSHYVHFFFPLLFLCFPPLQVKVQRFDVFLTPSVEASLPVDAAEVTLWRPGACGGTANPKAHPLSLYSVQSVWPIRLGKSMVLPERIAAYEVRYLPRWANAGPATLCMPVVGPTSPW